MTRRFDHLPDVLATIALPSGTVFLARRYNTSASFERPYHFIIVTLLLVGLAILCGPPTRQILHGPSYKSHDARLDPSRPSRPKQSSSRLFKSLRKLDFRSLLFSDFTVLVACIVTRTLLFWHTLSTNHCSVSGLWALLPALVTLNPANILWSIFKRNRSHDGPQLTGESWSIGRFFFLISSLIWAAFALRTEVNLDRKSGFICLPANLELSLLVEALITVFLDAVIFGILVRLRRVVDDESKRTAWSTISTACLSSSLILFALALPPFLISSARHPDMTMRSLAVSNILADSAVACAVILSTIHLISSHNAAVVGILLVSVTVFTQLSMIDFDGSVFDYLQAEHPSLRPDISIFVVLGLILSFNIDLGMDSKKTTSRHSNTSRLWCACYIIIILVFIGASRQAMPLLPPNSIHTLITNAKVQSTEWAAGAHKSKTFNEAVLEYRRRYTTLPPFSFDKWYRFAKDRGSIIFDAYDQIYDDLLPFWDIPPAELRASVDRLLTTPGLQIGGIVIKDGKVDIWAATPGTHMWMMLSMKDMIMPFAEWLPDMHVPFNLDDECRVSVPFSEMERHKKSALAIREGLRYPDNLIPPSKDLSPPWASNEQSEGEGDRPTSWAVVACPPQSPANTVRWWNRQLPCDACAAPHTDGDVVVDWTLSGDLCHQPDLAHLHGFLNSPPNAKLTHNLLPLFSQGRMQNFADILFPSPWNYVDKVEYDQTQAVKWAEKQNTLFWRGSASDGFATHGAWQGFLRARFVHLFTKKAPETSPSETESSLTGDVAFVGDFQKCDQRDCALENATFSITGPIDFQTHWQHKHLMDMDGEGFSGRFLPFLRSRSVPWHAGLFRTWWEERVHAWVHFVPVDVRLREVPKLMRFFGGEGDKSAEEIARRGKEWGDQVVRKEDMEVYMFRLLLEWGRLIDDHREHVAFGAPVG